MNGMFGGYVLGTVMFGGQPDRPAIIHGRTTFLSVGTRHGADPEMSVGTRVRSDSGPAGRIDPDWSIGVAT